MGSSPEQTWFPLRDTHHAANTSRPIPGEPPPPPARNALSLCGQGACVSSKHSNCYLNKTGVNASREAGSPQVGITDVPQEAASREGATVVVRVGPDSTPTLLGSRQPQPWLLCSFLDVAVWEPLVFLEKPHGCFVLLGK